MDYNDMLEKMTPMNRTMFCSLLSVAEPPEAVCRQYFAMKTSLDKISAPISPVDLLRIAMDVGFNVHTRKFDGRVEPVEITVDEVKPVTTIELDGLAEEIESTIDPNAETTITSDPKTWANNDPNPVDQDVIGEVDTVEVAEEVNTEEAGKAASKLLAMNEAKENLLEEGTMIEAYIDGEAKEGVIQSGEVVKGVATYKVLIEGAVHELTEDDIE